MHSIAPTAPSVAQLRSSATTPTGRFCVSAGHREIPAAAIGVFDDGDEACTDVAYCATCALALSAAGEFTVSTVLDPLALGATACPTCRGTGRLARDSGDPVPAVASSPHVAAVLQLLHSGDDTAPAEMTGLFYARAYWDLRMAVEDLLQGGGTGEVSSASLQLRTL